MSLPAAGVQEGGESEEEEAGAEFVVSPPQHGHLRPGDSWRTVRQGATGDRERGAEQAGHVRPRGPNQRCVPQVPAGQTRQDRLRVQGGRQLLAVQVRVERCQPQQAGGTLHWAMFYLSGGWKEQHLYWRKRIQLYIQIRTP